MPSRSGEGPRVDNGLGYMYPVSQLYYSWNHSPRSPDGSLTLRANTVSRTDNRYRITGRKLTRNNHDRRAIYGMSARYPNPQTVDPSFTSAVTNRAYRRLINSLRGEKAEMGITAATWKQSWLMIATRANQIRRLAARAEREAARENKRRKARRARIARARGRPQRLRPRDYLPVGSANVFLEGIFGWLPLLSDIHQMTKVLADDFPTEFVSETVRESKSLVYPPPGTAILSGSAVLTVRVNQACFARVSNPNVWLMNKLGLINPALVAWDLVPWSFVVNMFANVNHVLSSYTDTAGLTLSNASTTTQWKIEESWHARSLPGFDQIEEFAHYRSTVKSRRLGLTLPVLQTRLPGLEWGNALIAVSLMVQQISRLEFFSNSPKRK